MKYVLLYPQIKLYNEIHNTAQNCTTKCTTNAQRATVPFKE